MRDDRDHSRLEPPRAEVPQAGGSGDPLDVLIHVELSCFASLRRAIGPARANLVVLEAAERIAAVLPEASVTTAGRNLIELSFPVPHRAALDGAVAQLHAAFQQPLAIGNDGCQVTPTLGCAVAERGCMDQVQLVEDAERALARARQSLPGSAPSLQVLHPIVDDAALGVELRRAIRRDELFVQYQPKLHLRRQAITSVEALIRWQHPVRGLVMPSDFIPGAERCGAIGEMTLWTLRQVIADQRVLVRNGHELPIFINIAGALLSQDAFVAAAIAMIVEHGARIGFEITETSVIHEPEHAIRNLQRLAEIGVAITIDDYGAGLSSLAYLKQLPARELKIDKLFVTKLSSSHRDPLIVRSTIDLAHALEMEVVAEGVETATSLALLSVMGCDMVQGFLISRPVALEALIAYLRDQGHRAVIEKARSPVQAFTAVRAQA